MIHIFRRGQRCPNIVHLDRRVMTRVIRPATCWPSTLRESLRRKPHVWCRGRVRYTKQANARPSRDPRGNFSSPCAFLRTTSSCTCRCSTYARVQAEHSYRTRARAYLRRYFDCGALCCVLLDGRIDISSCTVDCALPPSNPPPASTRCGFVLQP